MQYLTQNTFPAQFVLYMPSRSSSKDPYSGFILMNAELVTASDIPTYHKLSPVYISSSIPSLEFDKNPFDTYCYPGHNRSLCFKGNKENVTAQPYHRSRYWNIPVRLTGTPTLVPVIEIHKINTLFSNMLRRNAIFNLSAAAVSVAAPPAPPMLAPPDLTTGVIAHVVSTPATKIIKKKKPLSVSAHTSASDISIHVAHQLLELAQIKKEMCPIIAEEYTTGETAVMPCGHLFSKLAIQESFKKEVNKCPACRQTGRPTYI
jgi:hypothetical protein